MIDIDAARKLVHALERDLAKVADGSADIQTLKSEVETLRNVLQSPDPGHGWVRDALQSIHAAIQTATETAKVDAIIAGRYAAAIGKMLGL